METQNDFTQLNPQVRETTVGIRKLRRIKIYPLSMADQIELTDLISAIIQELFSKEKTTNAELIEMIRVGVRDNLTKVVELVTDEGGSLLKEITNEQAFEIGEIVYDVNFGCLEKKMNNLIRKVKGVVGLQSEKSFVPSSEPIPNTDLKTSLEGVGEKEE